LSPQAQNTLREFCNKLKPIICIKPRGSKQIPVELRENADQLVGWNSLSLIKAISELTEFKT